MSPTNRKPNLRRLREGQGWTREQLAERIAPARRGEHLNVRTLDRWEAGDTPIPEPRWAELAAIFSVSVAHLLGWEDENGNGDGNGERVARVA